MRIDQIHIQGYRCLTDISFRVGDVATLIGPNGVGKSSVLRALDWFFNGSPGDLNECDLSAGDANQIRVEVRFCDLTEHDRKELGRYAQAGVKTVTLWKTWQNGVERFSGNARAYPDFQEIRAASNATDKRKAYNHIQETTPSLDLPSVSNASEVDAAIAKWESEHPDKLNDVEISETTNFFGFLGGAKLSGIFDFVFVSADLRASDETIDTKNATIGKLLERTIDRTAAIAEVEALYEDLTTKQQDLVDEKLSDELRLIGAELTDYVKRFSIGREVKIAAASPNLKKPSLQFETSVLDGSLSTDVAGQGHGFQRALLLAALELVAKKGQRDSSAGTIYLAIEEPELYQHPAQARSLAATLRGLAEDTNHAIQVAYATHSPMLVEPGKFNQLIRLRHAEGLPVSGHGTTAITANSETVIKKLSGIKSEESVRKQVDKMCPSQLAEAFFADVALLVEGETDKAFFEGIIQKEPNLRARNLAIVDCGGKSNIPLCKAILESLQIHTLIVADTDSDQNCEDKENATSKDRDKCENIKRLNSTLCKVVSVTPSDWPEEGFQADGDLVFLEPNLEKSLKNHWSEWSQACDELVRTGVGYEGKHSLTYKNAAIEADRCPELFQRIIHRLDELSGGKLPLSNP